MASENLECPVARKSLLPYLAGEFEGKKEGAAFEAHVADCDICRGLLSDRRKAMQVLLAVAEEKETPSTPELPALASLKKNKMTLVFSGIAIALLAVSYFTRPGSDLLGEKLTPSDLNAEATTNKAAETTAPPKHETQDPKPETTEKNSSTETTVPAAPATTPAHKAEPPTTSSGNASSQVEEPQPKPAETNPPVTKTATPKSTVSRDKPRATDRRRVLPKRTVIHKPVATDQKPAVEVFDEYGRKIGDSNRKR